jgi:hypothetical protein
MKFLLPVTLAFALAACGGGGEGQSEGANPKEDGASAASPKDPSEGITSSTNRLPPEAPRFNRSYPSGRIVRDNVNDIGGSVILETVDSVETVLSFYGDTYRGLDAASAIYQDGVYLLGGLDKNGNRQTIRIEQDGSKTEIDMRWTYAAALPKRESCTSEQQKRGRC